MDSSADASSRFDADDNAFYEQLTRQILMLTDEDDDNTGMYRKGVIRKPVVYGHGHGGPKLEPMKYYSWSETGRCSVPSWMESLWAKGGGGGTGVFIPTARSNGKRSGRRRYNDKAKRNNDRDRMHSGVGQKIHG
ncbi:hypothetical protein Ccrd_016319 [Cynara cardunculus var. scolymus]|uniref:Uncharacterized protein n=1 Tax=Cynara cardunculus var. scolymus TaxID=59895 RepID=A0A103YA72_CYNCS|nr:hypothetical protein Ccrd_016319 [Cynara cardunculus var. scolymus]